VYELSLATAHEPSNERRQEYSIHLFMHPAICWSKPVSIKHKSFLKPKWSPHTLKAYVVHANKFEDCDEFHSVFRQQPKRQDSRSGQVQGPQSASLEVLFYDSL
jgi:hypothetical protein